MTKVQYREADAVISDCGRYRYLLRRVWDPARPRAMLVMLNPSTADAFRDDPTIKSCIRLLSALGYGSMEVVNLFAFRATNPNRMPVADAVGPKNNLIIEASLHRCNVAIYAWGAHHLVDSRWKEVNEIVRAERPAAFCFGRTKYGYPKHPLARGKAFIKTGTPLETFN